MIRSMIDARTHPFTLLHTIREPAYYSPRMRSLCKEARLCASGLRVRRGCEIPRQPLDTLVKLRVRICITPTQIALTFRTERDTRRNPEPAALHQIHAKCQAVTDAGDTEEGVRGNGRQPRQFHTRHRAEPLINICMPA
jgi:hypothetical protein